MSAGYTVREYNTDDMRDAERLAVMFNSFDSVWPGGFSQGLKPSPANLFDSMQRMQRLAICVVQHEDEFVGYCDLHAQAGETDTAYIPLLGASPGHHGKGVGKMLLLEMVRRVTALGFRELTLHTWGGNMKAVPLYKKTGFNWEPETNVFMRNFLPGLLNSPAGRSFFADRNWYDCMVRDLTVEPDETIWNDMKVFPYVFKDGEAMLKATFEMASGGMTRLETQAYSVSCAIKSNDGEAPAGDTVPILWTIVPKADQKIELILLTETDDGLDLQIREHITIDGPTDIERTLRVLPDTRPRHEGERERCVRSTLVINGEPAALETGVKVVRPLEIRYSGQGLIQHRNEKVVVSIKSNLDRDVCGTLSIDAVSGIEVGASGAERNFTLPARHWTQCEFDIKAIRTGSYSTTLRCRYDGSALVTRPAYLRVFGGPTPVTSIDLNNDEQIVQESVGVRITHKLRGGRVKINNKSAGHTTSISMAELGPPFTSWRRRQLLLQGRHEAPESGGGVTLSIEYPEFPGIVLERTVTQLAGDVIKTDYRVINTTNSLLPVKLRLSLHQREARRIALPLPGGVIRENRADWDMFPVGPNDALAAPGDLTESWLAFEEEHTVGGVIWSGAAELELDWHSGLTLDLGEIEPHTTRDLEPIFTVTARGNWETVRGWWRRLVQSSGTIEQDPITAESVLRVHVGKPVLLLTSDVTEADLHFENRRGKAISAEMSLEGKGLSIAPLELRFTSIDRDSPARRRIIVTDEGGYGAGVIRATVRTDVNSREFKLPVVRIASAGSVHVEPHREGLINVDNGVIRFTVAPKFLGSMTSLVTRADGINHLNSAYPKQRPFVWFNPWFGGVHPFLDWMGSDDLGRETFTGEPIEGVTGADGLVWSGVRVRCTPQHRNLRWFQMEADYLTLPGSDMVALIFRWINLSDAVRHKVTSGFAVWNAVGGDRSQAITHWSHEGECRHRRRGGFAIDLHAGDWAAVENAVTGHRIELVGGINAHVNIDDMADEGPQMAASHEISLQPGETRELLSWLILNPALTEFEHYAALGKLHALP